MGEELQRKIKGVKGLIHQTRLKYQYPSLVWTRTDDPMAERTPNVNGLKFLDKNGMVDEVPDRHMIIYRACKDTQNDVTLVSHNSSKNVL